MMDNGRLYQLYQNDMDDDDKVIHQLVIPLRGVKYSRRCMKGPLEVTSVKVKH